MVSTSLILSPEFEGAAHLSNMWISFTTLYRLVNPLIFFFFFFFFDIIMHVIAGPEVFSRESACFSALPCFTRDSRENKKYYFARDQKLCVLLSIKQELINRAP